MTIKHYSEINASCLKTTYSYTGKLVGDEIEQKLLFLKTELIRKALKQFQSISTCGELCFQIYDQTLLFYFNYNETTKTFQDTLNLTL